MIKWLQIKKQEKEGQNTDRIIFHCDCNSFFASCEEKLAPELKNVPMAVAGDPENRHGIILAKNQLAKRYGIQTAETIWQARKKCPELVCVPPHHSLYKDISDRVNAIYLSYTDLTEPASIDESYLDVTNSIHLFGKSAEALANEIRCRVREEAGITISVGVSFCKSIAKFGSDYKKPDATTMLTRDRYKEIMYPLPVSDFLMVGKKTVLKLSAMGIKTIGQLAACPKDVLERSLGKAGVLLYDNVTGNDTERVHSFYEEREVKSVGHSMTFRRDLKGEEELREGVSLMSDMVAARLRSLSKKGCVVQLTVKDPDFISIQRQKTLPFSTNLQKEITDAAFLLLRENWSYSHPVRLLGVSVSGLCGENEDFRQLDLFAPPVITDERQENIENTMDAIRKKFGKSSIGFGHFKNDDTGMK